MTLKVTLTRSTIGRPKNQRKVVEALGLKKNEPNSRTQR